MAFVKVPNSHGGKRGHGHISTELKQIPSWGGREPDQWEDSRTNVVHITPFRGSKQPLAACTKELFGRDPFYFCKTFFLFFFQLLTPPAFAKNRCGVTETNPNLSCSDLKAHISSLLVILQITGGNLRSAADWKTAQSSFNPDRECRRITLSILKHRHITSLSLT